MKVYGQVHDGNEELNLPDNGLTRQLRSLDLVV